VNRILISNTDRLIALGEDMKMRLCQEKGAQPERVVVIPDWADGEVIRPVLKENPFSIQHELADRFVVMHAGNLGLSQNLEILIEAASMLKDLTDLLVVFLGDGVKRSALEEQVRHLGLSNVRFFPYQPKDRVALAFGSADCFVILLKPGLSGYITPSKLYGILAAGRPYVASIDPTSDVARITEQYRCGVVVPAGDPKALADALRRLYHDRKEAQLMGKRAREAFASYDRSVGVKKYHTLFSELVAHHRR
jgi:glycosyltransferase involved in cell wall biosynthesis